MSATRSQNDRVLRALQRRGRAGITAIDFIPPTIDDGATLLRLPARINELRRKGHPISTEMVKVGRARVARYRLDADAGVQPEHLAAEKLRTGPRLAPSKDERRASELRLSGQAALDLGEADRRPLSPYDPKAEA